MSYLIPVPSTSFILYLPPEPERSSLGLLLSDLPSGSKSLFMDSKMSGHHRTNIPFTESEAQQTDQWPLVQADDVTFNTWLAGQYTVPTLEDAKRSPQAVHVSSPGACSDSMFDTSFDFNSIQPGMRQFKARHSQAVPSHVGSDFAGFEHNFSLPTSFAVTDTAIGSSSQHLAPGRSFEGSTSNARSPSPKVSMSSEASDEEGTERGLEEDLLLKLKVEQNLAWKKISKIFKDELGKDYSVPALQMRYRRLRQRRLLDFTEKDQAALTAAYEYWETKRWEIISAKMVEFGATEAWTPKACSAAWMKLHNNAGGRNSQQEHFQADSEAWSRPDPT